MTNGGGQSDDDPGECGIFVSPPFYMHEIDPAYGGLVHPGQTRDVARWRKAERERLISARLALSIEERTDHAARLASELDVVIKRLAARSVARAEQRAVDRDGKRRPGHPGGARRIRERP